MFKKLETLVKKEPEFVFETIFRLYYDKLFQIAKIYLNNKEDAEEIVQNVFLRLWDKLNLLTGINNINSYLFTLTKNACLNFLKHRKIRSNFHNNKKEEARQNHFCWKMNFKLKLMRALKHYLKSVN